MSTTKLDTRYVGVNEAATYLGVSAITIRRRIADGSLPGHKVAGTSLRVRIADLEKLVEPIKAAK